VSTSTWRGLHRGLPRRRSAGMADGCGNVDRELAHEPEEVGPLQAEHTRRTGAVAPELGEGGLDQPSLELADGAVKARGWLRRSLGHLRIGRPRGRERCRAARGRPRRAEGPARDAGRRPRRNHHAAGEARRVLGNATHSRRGRRRGQGFAGCAAACGVGWAPGRRTVNPACGLHASATDASAMPRRAARQFKKMRGARHGACTSGWAWRRPGCLPSEAARAGPCRRAFRGGTLNTKAGTRWGVPVTT